MMLARHAEDLFWAGRYIERAEDTARLLDVTYHSMLESPLLDAASAWRELLELLYLDRAFVDKGLPVTDGTVTEFLVLDPENAGSIVRSVARARDNARNVRERISTELWEAINTLFLELRARDLRADLESEPYQLYRFVKSRCQTISGVSAETMSRDDGWRFFLLGRMLERAEMTCRLLSVRFGRSHQAAVPSDVHYWIAVLKSVSAFEAYLRAHRAQIDPLDVLEFLLLSRDFPRSVLFALRASESELVRLGGGEAPSKPERLLGRLRADLEYMDIHEIVDNGLPAALDALQQGVLTVAQSVERHFFRAAVAPELHAFESA
jgi:uncharacterized alpha-E superfamily protein